MTNLQRATNAKNVQKYYGRNNLLRNSNINRCDDDIGPNKGPLMLPHF
jgi:hypothetical protein